eukprot:3101880-Pyramimonas_sp.AAC.1
MGGAPTRSLLGRTCTPMTCQEGGRRPQEPMRVATGLKSWERARPPWSGATRAAHCLLGWT